MGWLLALWLCLWPDTQIISGIINLAKSPGLGRFYAWVGWEHTGVVSLRVQAVKLLCKYFLFRHMSFALLSLLVIETFCSRWSVFNTDSKLIQVPRISDRKWTATDGHLDQPLSIQDSRDHHSTASGENIEVESESCEVRSPGHDMAAVYVNYSSYGCLYKTHRSNQ